MLECRIFESRFEREDCAVAEQVSSLTTPRLVGLLIATTTSAVDCRGVIQIWREITSSCGGGYGASTAEVYWAQLSIPPGGEYAQETNDGVPG